MPALVAGIHVLKPGQISGIDDRTNLAMILQSIYHEFLAMSLVYLAVSLSGREPLALSLWP
jgi:hypothetical protein